VPEDGEGKPVLDENGEERRGVEARGKQGVRKFFDFCKDVWQLLLTWGNIQHQRRSFFLLLHHTFFHHDSDAL